MVIAEIPRTCLQLIKLVTDLKWIRGHASVGIFGTRISVVTVSPENTIVSFTCL